MGLWACHVLCLFDLFGFMGFALTNEAADVTRLPKLIDLAFDPLEVKTSALRANAAFLKRNLAKTLLTFELFLSFVDTS